MDFLTFEIHSTNVFYTDFMESSALMDRTVCPFKIFIFSSVLENYEYFSASSLNVFPQSEPTLT